MEYRTKEDVLARGMEILSKTLRDFVPSEEVSKVEAQEMSYGKSRKGFLGDCIEWFLFGKKPDGVSGPDFAMAGVELKTNPLKNHPTKTYVSKERLVFSMIDYPSIVDESWETSSFLKKNKVLLLMFYLYLKEGSILDYEFKFVKLLDLIDGLSEEDAIQIREDWEFIVDKIKKGEAHLLSEADTYYLGACTKAQNSRIVRDQPFGVPAKPRAFSLKSQYLNYLIQQDLLGNKAEAVSVLKKYREKGGKADSIENMMRKIFVPYIGKDDLEIMDLVNWHPAANPKDFKRRLVNKILGAETGRIEELEKANVTLKVITLEHTGTLKESVSFPAFDYKDLVTQVWYDEESEEMADFHAYLETKKFLFVVFRKEKASNRIHLEKILFWNFPMKDLPEAERVWRKTIDCVNEGRYNNLPKITDSYVAHVRPHGRNSQDTSETPQGTREMKKSFWLNAKYIQEALEKAHSKP